MTRAERVALLNKLLGLGQDEEVLVFCLMSCEQAILDYCALSELPEALEPLLVQMAADKFRMSGFGAAETPTGPVKSLSEGSKSVTFSGAAEASADTSGLLNNYAAQLQRYRRLRWPE